MQLSPREFPELLNFVGQTLVTADGTTLLGADDKAGIAEIMAALTHLVNHPEIEHGKIMAAFTPTKRLATASPISTSRASGHFAYTVDGGKLGELEFENFNASRAFVDVHGNPSTRATPKA
jgi:tripeptide aminopeptidase